MAARLRILFFFGEPSTEKSSTCIKERLPYIAKVSFALCSYEKNTRFLSNNTLKICLAKMSTWMHN